MKRNFTFFPAFDISILSKIFIGEKKRFFFSPLVVYIVDSSESFVFYFFSSTCIYM